jgi:3-oxoacyl-[acyl-carrier-protein] synthase II
MNRDDAVWITGIGTATPLGLSYDELATNLMAGRSGVRPVTHFDPVDQPCRIAATLPPIPPPEPWDQATFSTLGHWEQLLVWCGVQALRDAGLWEARSDLRIGLVIGLGSEWLLQWEADMHRGGRRVSEPERDHTSLAAFLHQALDLRGPRSTTAAACASGNIALGLARRWIEQGWVDACVAGACDRSISPMGMAGFGNLGALSRRNDDPEAASRPFDRARDGFVMGEGGALFVLESALRARRRDARAHGAIAGFGASSDAHHMVIPSSDPVPCIHAMKQALVDAGIGPGDIDYLNAHATSTPVGDRFEARVIREVLGASVRDVPVSSTKSMTGHLLGATSAVEAIACLAALERNTIPPTINLDDPDPECELFHVAHEALSRPLDVVVSNSFGFGGSNTCLVLRRADGVRR